MLLVERLRTWQSELVKAYLQKKGTTTDKCASSAESDLFILAVALLDAVIPQAARRCHLLVGWLLRAATIAFTTSLWAIQTKRVIRENHLIRLQDGKRGAYVPENIVPISDWSTMFPRICVPCFLAGRQPWVAIFGIADTSAIPKITFHGAVNPFPTNLCVSKPSEQNNSYANIEVYCESLPTEKGTTTMKCTTSAEGIRSICRWHSALRLIPKQPEGVISPSNDSFERQ